MTKRFLEEHPEELTKYQKYDLSKPTMVGIARFLGWDDENKKGPWHPDRISYSLERLKMIIKTQRILGQLIQDGQRRGEIARQDMGGANISNGVPERNTVKTLFDIGITRKESA